MNTVTVSSAVQKVNTGLHSVILSSTSYRMTIEQIVEIIASPVRGCTWTQDRSWNTSSFGQETIASAEDWARFRLLIEKWHKERGITSSSTKMVSCPSYQRIIGMGDKVVPLILRQMQSEGDDPDHWFWALEMITDADPVPVEAYGDTVSMAQAWLSWAEGRYTW
jgi:hypothetical protein